MGAEPRPSIAPVTFVDFVYTEDAASGGHRPVRDRLHRQHSQTGAAPYYLGAIHLRGRARLTTDRVGSTSAAS
ncbi:MAG: hypothetical protein MZW92_13790 [Comamonadaceae bacterium]|nr:hypothetical protein [Comamonadaceae bacterium]